MNTTLRKFSYEIKSDFDCDTTGDIHIEGAGDPGHDTLCGHVQIEQTEIETDKMPNCSECLNLYNMIKNGKLRK